MTGPGGNVSRAARNDIKNGVRRISFMALSALFDVSLWFTNMKQTNKVIDRRTHDKHHIIVITVSANSYTVLRTFSGGLEDDANSSANFVEIWY